MERRELGEVRESDADDEAVEGEPRSGECERIGLAPEEEVVRKTVRP